MALQLIKAATAFEHTNEAILRIQNEKRSRVETWLNGIFNTSLSENVSRGLYTMTLEVPAEVDVKETVRILKEEFGYRVRWNGGRGKAPHRIVVTWDDMEEED